MSNIHLGLPYPGGVVDHSSNLAHDIGALYLNDEYSDVTLQVNGQTFHAHRVILAARSQYFRALLFGGLRESHQAEVEIKDTNLTAFKVLLKYIYTGWVSLSSEKEETVLDILGLAHQYGFEDLESAICDYLKDALCIPNICVIYDMASLYNLTNLKAVCEDFMDKNALAILNHESFYSLSPSALKSIIGRDSFCAPEVHIFQGVTEWVERNSELSQEETQEILSQIRLPLISLSDLLNVVRPTSLISPDQILDAIKAKNESRDMDLQYRGYLRLFRLTMATVIRIKRRLDEEPTENIVIKAKRSRKEKADEEEDYLPVGESSTVLMRVGTLESKEEAIEPLVLKAIKKGWELRESYKKLGGSGTTYKTKTTQEARQRAISKRYKIISQSRGIELPLLDKKGACIGTEESQLIKDKKDEVAGAEALPDTSMELSCFDAILANEKEDVITCNGVPLESEKYVYDVFYSTQPVNWEEVMEENLCRIERQVFETLSGSDSDERYDDEDDENEEGNWRNDYPDYDDSPCEDEEDYLNSQIRKAKNLKNFETDESYDEEDYEDEGFDIDGKLIERYSLSKLVRSMKVGESSSTSDSEDE